MYFTKVPKVAQLFYPQAIWSSKNNPNLLLTFDDGPHPESTPELLACLKRQNLQATFFCTGKQAEKHPQLVDDLLSEGHTLGYHGYAHLNGWKTTTTNYLADLNKNMKCFSSKLFRPAYGKITKSQFKEIRKKLALDIVLWSHMPGDFDKNISAEVLTKRISKANRKGNIIVLHDKPECSSKVYQALSNFKV